MFFDFGFRIQARYAIKLIVCGAVFLIWSQPGAAKPPPRVYGEYVGIGCPVRQKIAGCVPTTAKDRVQILRGRGGQATVKIRIVFGAGQTCSLEGKADWAGGVFTVRAEGLDPQKPCRLVIRVSGSVLTLADQDGFCREVYCGSRGVFQGARFRKKS